MAILNIVEVLHNEIHTEGENSLCRRFLAEFMTDVRLKFGSLRTFRLAWRKWGESMPAEWSMIRYSGCSDIFDTNITCFKLLLEIDWRWDVVSIELIRPGATSVHGAYINKNWIDFNTERKNTYLQRGVRSRVYLFQTLPEVKLSITLHVFPAVSNRDRGLACGEVSQDGQVTSESYTTSCVRTNGCSPVIVVPVSRATSTNSK